MVSARASPSDGSVIWAVPPVRPTGDPKLLPLTWNWIVPVGVPLGLVPKALEFTKAVKVSDWPKAGVAVLATTDTLVGSLVTVNADEVLDEV
jgi:hypothetical protein